MSQATTVLPTTGPSSMAAWAALANAANAALLSKFSGGTAPSTFAGLATYQWWVDTSFTPARLKIYDGSTWPFVGAVDAVNHKWVPAARPVVASTADKTAALVDANKLVEMNLGTTMAFSIPSSTTVVFPVPSEFVVIQKGAGQVSILPLTTTMTINGSTLAQKITKRYGQANVYQSSSDAWIASGDIST